MQFIDLAAQQVRIRSEIESAIMTVLNHGNYIMGPEIKKLESLLADFTGIRHAIGCSSGTDALLMALMAYDIKQGDAVFMPPFTFISTAEVVSLLGATPVFVDIDPTTFNISPNELAKAIQAIKNKDNSYPLPRMAKETSLIPKAIITVDLFGLPADYDPIHDLAQIHGLLVIEDAAQSFGASYHGRKACSLCEIGCTSFFPAKPLGCYGDGGAIFTNNDGLAEKIRSIRVHGQGEDKYNNVRTGINGRLDTIQAAILIEKLKIFPEEIALRQQVADRYRQLLAKSSDIQTPIVPDGLISVWAQYSILTKDSNHRQAIQKKLNASGIPSAIYYPKPLHLQKAYENLQYQFGDFPISEQIASRILSLPMHPYLKKEDQQKIADVILSISD